MLQLTIGQEVTSSKHPGQRFKFIRWRHVGNRRHAALKNMDGSKGETQVAESFLTPVKKPATAAKL